MRLLLGSTNAANRGPAIRALTLGDRLAILRGSLHRVLHDLLRTALHAVSLDFHVRSPFNSFISDNVCIGTHILVSNVTQSRPYLIFFCPGAVNGYRCAEVPSIYT